MASRTKNTSEGRLGFGFCCCPLRLYEGSVRRVGFRFFLEGRFGYWVGVRSGLVSDIFVAVQVVRKCRGGAKRTVVSVVVGVMLCVVCLLTMHAESMLVPL